MPEGSIEIDAVLVPNRIRLKEKTGERIVEARAQIDQATVQIKILAVKEEWLVKSGPLGGMGPGRREILGEDGAGGGTKDESDAGPRDRVIPFIVHDSGLNAKRHVARKRRRRLKTYDCAKAEASDAFLVGESSSHGCSALLELQAAR